MALTPEQQKIVDLVRSRDPDIADEIAAEVEAWAQDFETERTFTLLVPIELGTEKVTQITLREPDVDQLVLLDGQRGNAATRTLISQVGGVAPKLVGKLKSRDFTAMSNWLNRFFD
jgi:hypothetical protein